MSWVPIKKAVNSDFKDPLNYLEWTKDLAVFGKEGYVYKDPNKMAELAAKSSSACSNSVAFGFLIDGYAGETFKTLTKDTTGAFNEKTSFSQVASDAAAMSLVADNEIAMNMIANNKNALTTALNIAAARNAVVAKSGAVTAISKSIHISDVVNHQNFMNALCAQSTFDLFMNDSKTRMAMYNSSVAELAIRNSSTAMTIMDGRAVNASIYQWGHYTTVANGPLFAVSSSHTSYWFRTRRHGSNPFTPFVAGTFFSTLQSSQTQDGSSQGSLVTRTARVVYMS